MKKKILKKTVKSLTQLNQYFTEGLENEKQISENLKYDEENCSYRTAIMKKFLVQKGYTEHDFREFLHERLTDDTYPENEKQNIRIIFREILQ